MPAKTTFSPSLLEAVGVEFIFPCDTKDALTLNEWCEAKGLKRARMEGILAERVSSGVLAVTKKFTADQKVAKAWGLKDVVERAKK